MKIDIAPLVFSAISPNPAFVELSNPTEVKNDPSGTYGNRFAYRKFYVGTPTEPDVRRALESIRAGMSAFGRSPVVYGFRSEEHAGVQGVSFVGYSEIVVDDDLAIIAPGHNPDRLTLAQVGEGYELLDKKGDTIPEGADVWARGNASWEPSCIAGEKADACTFRVKIPSADPGEGIAPGFNPYKLTVAQVGEGYRLIREGEIIPEGSEIWFQDEWQDTIICKREARGGTFRIKADTLAPGHNPDKLTTEQVGAGYRLLELGERKPPGTEFLNSQAEWAPETLFFGDALNSFDGPVRAPVDHIAFGSNPHKLTLSQVGRGYRLLRIGENIPKGESQMFVGITYPSAGKAAAQWTEFSVLTFSGPVIEGMTFRVPVNVDTTSNLRDSYPEVAQARAEMKEAGEAHQKALDAYNEALKAGWERAKKETGHV